MSGWAARYSLDITTDLARGYSYAGWGLVPATMPDEAWEAWLAYTGAVAEADESDDPARVLARAREDWEDAGYHVEPLPGVVGPDGSPRYMVALPGLSAYYAETAEEAAELARQDDRWVGVPLWVFPARLIGSDQDAEAYVPGAAIVEPLGPAVSAEELGL